jgi:hypothetical protein
VSRRFRLSLMAAAAALVSAVAAAPAGAGVLVASAEDCDNGPVSKPFAAYGDQANYFLVPGGDFAGDSSGWAFDGAAAGNGVLTVPSGASATSPAVCVGLEHPTSRFFVRKASGGLLSSLRVDVLAETSVGLTVAVPVATIGAGSAFAPSPIVVNVANLLPLLPGEHTPMALRFTGQGGTFQVDDVYVDPYGRG